jgi:PAS domain-containing protein
MLAKLAFLHTTDDRFIVLSEILSEVPHARPARFSVTTFDHEHSFLALAATAGLEEEQVVDIIANVLLSVSQPVVPHRWVDVELEEDDIERLRLLNEIVQGDNLLDRPTPTSNESTIGFEWDGKQFYNFLAHAPTPFVMMEGPEHTVKFINDAYVRLIGRMTDEFVTGYPIRKVLPELEGQPFFGILDRVYKTGVPFIGVEAPAILKSEFTGEDKHCFFDFIYHPLRNKEGIVSGIMVQSMEVTERVIARDVADSREQKLYTQWLELEAIYNNAPVGVALFDAHDLRVCRINDLQASYMGDEANALVGRVMKDAAFKVSSFKEVLERAARGELIKNAIIKNDPESPEEGQRTWSVSITPFFAKSGTIEKLSSISLEISDLTAKHAVTA